MFFVSNTERKLTKFVFGVKFDYLSKKIIKC